MWSFGLNRTGLGVTPVLVNDSRRLEAGVVVCDLHPPNQPFKSECLGQLSGDDFTETEPPPLINRRQSLLSHHRQFPIRCVSSVAWILRPETDVQQKKAPMHVGSSHCIALSGNRPPNSVDQNYKVNDLPIPCHPHAELPSGACGRYLCNDFELRR